ncbi:MAG TPA: heparan-alpha-glucosaminide N-acetyltransferase domain-containing protein [Geminicoccaceae bacterium]|jgi:uncharacterized membrane protein|nr:heparan-alpha-glucosaminide N-acetyltransferase domain-containing protein [Geminicoccaceae bacterium]
MQVDLVQLTGRLTMFEYRAASAIAPGAWALPKPGGTSVPLPGRIRLDAIDLLRGVVMVLMALDHTRDFFAAGGFNPRDVNDPALFLTRWVTHFCAPVFVFLAGTSAFLYGARGRTVREVSWFLFTRGLWLVLLELTIVRFAWTFSVFPDLVLLQVIWAIGVSMIVLSGLIHLPRWAVGAIGIAMIAGHNLLDGIQAAQLGQLGWLWQVLHQPALLQPTPDVAVFALYPLIPWMGVMAAGYALGPVMLFEPTSRRRWLVGLGVGVTLGFILLRAANVYGDPAPWVPHDEISARVLSFLNTEKYPPSALYLAMTLGPALIALAAFEVAKGKLARCFVVFGRAPLFYYVAHLLLLHTMAVVFAATNNGDVAWLFGGLPIEAKSEGYGLSLPGVYLAWLCVVAALYLPCRWFAAVKRRHTAGWLSYL